MTLPPSVIDGGGYEIHVREGALRDAGLLVARFAPAHHIAIVSDHVVAAIYAVPLAAALSSVLRGARVSTHAIDPGERAKTRETWSALTDALLDAGAGRDTTVVALGGGVVGDLAGFVAATYMRGVPVVQLPTTLLAMVDASVGGKTGVDTPAGKNLVGAFHPPAVVIADVSTLETLPERELRAGVAEMIKHAVIGDAGQLERVATLAHSREEMASAIRESVAIKARVVREDAREHGLRKILNFGHTLGHAIEAASGYSLLHGEAVAIGMVLESRLAERMGVAERGTARAVEDAVRAARLPVAIPSGIAADAVLAGTRSDKKARGGRVEYALPARVGAMAGGESGWSIAAPDADVRAILA